jgi:hypothetical protein
MITKLVSPLSVFFLPPKLSRALRSLDLTPPGSPPVGQGGGEGHYKWYQRHLILGFRGTRSVTLWRSCKIPISRLVEIGRDKIVHGAWPPVIPALVGCTRGVITTTPKAKLKPSVPTLFVIDAMADSVKREEERWTKMQTSLDLLSSNVDAQVESQQ